MDLLRRELAPISDKAWEQIDGQARRLFQQELTARRVVSVSGPHGWEYNARPTGKMDLKPPLGRVEWGCYRPQPLVELRTFFELEIWELDRADRGAADIDLDALDQAVLETAAFEDRAVYRGLADGGMAGMRSSSPHAPIALGGEDLTGPATAAMTTLLESGISGPYSLVLPPDLWRALARDVDNYPRLPYLESLLKGPVLLSRGAEDALLVSMRGGDLELILGHDLAIGYHSHTGERVRLFITESFTFNINEPKAIVALSR